jgi:hydroxyacyl-ACP dehydratase HTD2-like protein with hotdog domain
MTTSDTTSPLLQEGAAITALRVRPTTVQLFRFSAATWNAHRIHYDQAYARDQEGYPDVLVQSHLHGCFLSRAVLGWAPSGAVLRRLRWENRGIAVPGDELTTTGVITSLEDGREGQIVRLDLEERNQDKQLCVRGSAELLISDTEPKGQQHG